MFCPQCGSTQNDELKFCKSCGANLHALRQIMASRDVDGKFDWNKTWVADMFRSGDDAVKQQVEIERLQGKTTEMKRQSEIKAGVITSSVGIALMILVFVVMNGIIAGGRISDAAVEILSRLWIVGVLPLLVGAALIFNGMFVSKKGGKQLPPVESADTNELNRAPEENYLEPAHTNQLTEGIPFSVTDDTTRHLTSKPQ